MSIMSVPPAPYAPARTGPTRATSGRVLWTEDFSDGVTGMYNDGIGSASVDHNIRFNGHPSVRLDPQNTSGTAALNGGNLSLTLGGSAQTITTASSATLVGTSAASGSPAYFAAGYITLIAPSSGGPTTDGNSYVLSYTSAATTGSTGAWTVTFHGVKIANIPGTPNTTLTTANIGTATMAACNPNPNPTGAAQPGVSVVFKRRMNDQFSGPFGHELWFRPTSKSAATAATSVFCHRLYNRDGNNAWAGAIFPQLAVGMTRAVWANDYILLWYATGTGTGGSGVVWTPLAFVYGAFNQHSWEPAQGKWDLAGCWNYSKLIVDFSTHEYVSYQLNETLYTAGIAGTPVYQVTGDTGAKIMHFSVELGESATSTNRFWHIAHVTGTAE